MLTTRTKPHLIITKRLDPGYYAPAHIKDEQQLRRMGCFELGECGKFFVGPFGSDLPGSLYKPSGIPLLRVSNIGALDMIEDGLVFLNEQDHQKLSASEVIPGDLLIVKASVGEKVCRFPSKFDRGNITQHIIAIRPNGYADMDYVAAVLFSSIGRRQLERRALGSIIQYLGVVDARGVLLPRLDPLAQRYIGDKVRQAERLRERATSLEIAARVALDQMIVSRRDTDAAVRELQRVLNGARGHGGRNKAAAASREQVLRARVTPDLLIGRLNSEAYQEEYLENDRVLKGSGWPLIPLSDLVVVPINNSIRGVTEHLTGTDEGVLMFRPADIDGLWMNEASAPRIQASFEEAHAKARVLPGDIVLAIAGTVVEVGRIGETVSYGNINGSAARIRLEDPFRGFALFFLESQYGKKSLMRLAVGSVQKHLNLEDLPDVRIPVPDPHHCVPFERALALSGRARRYAAALTTAATVLIEALINGVIPESDLVSAARALDAGDRTSDAAVLRHLTRSMSDRRRVFTDVEDLFIAIDESLVEAEGAD